MNYVVMGGWPLYKQEEMSNPLADVEAGQKQPEVTIPTLTMDLSQYVGTDQAEAATWTELIASDMAVKVIGLDLTSESSQMMLKLLDRGPFKRTMELLYKGTFFLDVPFSPFGRLGYEPLECGGPVLICFRPVDLRGENKTQSFNELRKLGRVAKDKSIPLDGLGLSLSGERTHDTHVCRAICISLFPYLSLNRLMCAHVCHAGAFDLSAGENGSNKLSIQVHTSSRSSTAPWHDIA